MLVIVEQLCQLTEVKNCFCFLVITVPEKIMSKVGLQKTVVVCIKLKAFSKHKEETIRRINKLCSDHTEYCQDVFLFQEHLAILKRSGPSMEAKRA